MCLVRRASVSSSCTVLQQGVCKTQREEEEHVVKGDFFSSFFRLENSAVLQFSACMPVEWPWKEKKPEHIPAAL